MAETGIDEALRLEAVYLSTPIPRNDAVLTVLGAVFDKAYFPGVHMPTTGYDPKDVEKEIERLVAESPLATISATIRALLFAIIHSPEL